MNGCLKILGLAFLALILLGSCVAALADRDPPRTPPVTVTTPADPETADAAPGPAPMGTEVRDGDFVFVVTGVQTGVERIGTEHLGATAQGRFTIVSLTVRNVGLRSQTLFDSAQKAHDAAGREFTTDSTAGLYLDANTFAEEINPGNQVTGKLVFDVPRSSSVVTVELHDDLFSDGVRVALG